MLTMDFTAASGSFQLTDFMPARHSEHDAARAEHSQSTILRLVKGIAGECGVEVVFKSTFDFAQAPSPIEMGDGGAQAWGGGVAMRLRCPVSLQRHEAGIPVARFRLRAGETRDFSLPFHAGVMPILSNVSNFDTFLARRWLSGISGQAAVLTTSRTTPSYNEARLSSNC